MFWLHINKKILSLSVIRTKTRNKKDQVDHIASGSTIKSNIFAFQFHFCSQDFFISTTINRRLSLVFCYIWEPTGIFLDSFGIIHTAPIHLVPCVFNILKIRRKNDVWIFVSRIGKVTNIVVTNSGLTMGAGYRWLVGWCGNLNIWKSFYAGRHTDRDRPSTILGTVKTHNGNNYWWRMLQENGTNE